MVKSEPKMITTEEFIKGMDTIRAEMAQQATEQAKERHRVNGITQTVISDVYLKTVAQDTVLNEIRRSVSRIEEVLVGDERFQKTGIIQTVATLETRMSTMEQTVATRSKIFTAVIAVLGALGAFITWIKDIGIFKP